VTDAMDMFKAMRPPSPAIGEDIRVSPQRTVPTVGGARDLHDLAMTPGSPAYRARIPRPPCYQCSEDHFPGRSYDHEWMAEPVAVHDEPVAASAVVRRPQIVDVPVAEHRVALYVGRGDTYVVAVEGPPDWDATTTFKVPPEQVIPLIQMARALGTRISDKTGGDLLMLEQDYEREHAQNHGRSAQANGSGSSRRPGLDPNGPQKGQQDGDDPTYTAVPGGAGGRDDPAG